MQKKDGRVVDPRLFSRICSPSFDLCRRLFREGQVQAALQWSEVGMQELRMATGVFSEEELACVEREHPEGVSSVNIVVLLTRKGVRFSEATLRKYVQLGLLPRSHRIGLKGKHRGSQGMYPANIIRRIVRLRAMMRDFTIEQIRHQVLFVRGDVEELERKLEDIFSALSSAVTSNRGAEASPRVVVKELSDARKLATELVAKITSVETRLSMQARLQR